MYFLSKNQLKQYFLIKKITTQKMHHNDERVLLYQFDGYSY